MTMPTGLGVDVHPYYQRGTNFDGVEYAWIKMADGAKVYAKLVAGVWYTADEQARRLRARGTPFGGYVYAQPGDGAAEARVLWGECQRLGGTGVAPACDIESDANIYIWSKSEATDHGRAFCSWYHGRGIRPAIYMGAAMAQLTRPDLWPEDPVIWVARYGMKPETLHNGVQYTGRYDIHQYSSSGSLPGSAGAVDWNQSYSSPGKTPGTAHLLGAAPTPTTEEIMKIAEPRDLQPAADWQRKVFAVEVGRAAEGGNSTVVDDMWLWLVSADFGDSTGSTEYRVWAGNDAGAYVGFGAGSSAPDGTGAAALKGNGTAQFVLKPGTRILTLEWKNTGKAQAGYSFPQVGQ
jgi:hypothetical protein